MACYCGCKTKRNKLTWLTLFLLTLLAIAAGALMVIEGIKCGRDIDDLPESDECAGSNNDRYGELDKKVCRDRFPECVNSGIGFWILIAAIVVSVVPWAVMCCCSRRPVKQGVVYHPHAHEAAVGHTAATTPPVATTTPAYTNNPTYSGANYGQHVGGTVAPAVATGQSYPDAKTTGQLNPGVTAEHGGKLPTNGAGGYGTGAQAPSNVAAGARLTPAAGAGLAGHGAHATHGAPAAPAESRVGGVPGRSYGASGVTDTAYMPGGPGSNTYSYSSQQYPQPLPPVNAGPTKATPAAAI